MNAARLSMVAALAFLGCAPAHATHTLHVRALLGAAEDGSYAYAELETGPAGEPAGRQVVVDPRGSEESVRALPDETARAAVGQVLEAGDARRPVAPALGEPSEAFAPIEAPLPGSDRPGEWPIEPAPGARGRLRLALTEGLDGEEQLTATVLLELPAGAPEEEILLRRIPWSDANFLTGVWPLPGGRVALLQWGAARQSRGAVYRVEDVAELRLGAAISALLDLHALRAMEKKDYATARELLELAVQSDPFDATAHYNLACAWAQLGEENRAILSLGEAVELDPERLVPHARRDPDLDPIRERVEFRLMIEPGREDRLLR